ncbi:response regulator transcription factor [Kitasatospora sp. NPDC050463]|uniref:response regulator transcription factor n=1 Tax=Kitasatospora sp. NPDC050463 TaxID=3155786 RepID=UPI00340C5059
MIRVLLADDQALIRGALASMLRLEPDLEVVGEVGSGAEVEAVALRTRPDVVLMDVQMPGKDGLAVTADLARSLPACKVVICTTFGRPGYLTRAVAAGAVGFVVKDAPPEQLVEAVRRAAAGLRVLDHALASEAMLSGTSPLTTREREVLAEALGGGTVTDIARALGLSDGTVRNHVSSAMAKTSARTRAEAARIAEERGWL